jgi:predicted RNA-binding protein with PIN domain
MVFSTPARYIVDGNNVMAQRVGWHRDKPAARERLVSDLAEFGQRSGSSIAVVFDGPDVPEQSGEALEIYPAPKGLTADDRIVELVASDADPGRLTVVTSDRALARRAGALGARTMRSGEFRRLLAY